MAGPDLEGQVQVRKKYPGPDPDRTLDSLVLLYTFWTIHDFMNFFLLDTAHEALGSLFAMLSINIICLLLLFLHLLVFFLSHFSPCQAFG